MLDSNFLTKQLVHDTRDQDWFKILLTTRTKNQLNFSRNYRILYQIMAMICQMMLNCCCLVILHHLLIVLFLISCPPSQLSLVLLFESIPLSLQSHHCTWWSHILRNLSLYMTTFAKYNHSRLQLESWPFSTINAFGFATWYYSVLVKTLTTIVLLLWIWTLMQSDRMDIYS